MKKKDIIVARWVMIMTIWLLPAILSATLTTSENARIVAENWIQFIVERDGSWGGARNPVIIEFRELTREKMVLGYFAAVAPAGYIIVSSLKEFSPIKAYSTTSSLNPEIEEGMCDLIKDSISRRNAFLIAEFGGLDDRSLATLQQFTRKDNVKAWNFLTAGGGLMRTELQSLSEATAGPVGPLLKSRWAQGEPFNDDCPDMQCPGAFNSNAVVGCVPLAIAQIMRYYCWPPYFESQYYDWENMLVNEANYNETTNWYFDENGVNWTQAQIDAVADLCYDAGKLLGNISYGCKETGAFICSASYHDARDAFEDNFYYDTANDEPDCEDRDEHSYDEWWSIIVGEINNNRPMMYGIENSDQDFYHAIVVDGYDDSAGGHKVHANYGWGENWHNTWYELDWFDCNTAEGWNTRCEWDTEEMIRDIYPRNGLNGNFSGSLSPWGGAGTLHHYMYCDVTSNDMTIQGGARVQFLPGVSLTCTGNSIDIDGGRQYETRFFSYGIPTRGLKVAEGGAIKLTANGSICMR